LRQPEEPWQTLEAMTLVPPATTVTRSYRLALAPGAVTMHGDAGKYSLLVRKQAGVPAQSLTVRVRVPAGSVVTQVSPNADRDGEWLVYRTPLDRDQLFEVHWQRLSAKD
jgi:hypothetical protein